MEWASPPPTASPDRVGLERRGTGQQRDSDPRRPGSERLADLAAATSSSHYLCGTGGRRYLDTAAFDAPGIQVLFFHTPVDPGAVGPPDQQPLGAEPDRAGSPGCHPGGPTRPPASGRLHVTEPQASMCPGRLTAPLGT
ncbi:WbqC family protein [Streptomyces canus]|uniref:WbqC family protein n=1 Tax=Streptomyces canus TaxID=58343 RepID=UPI00382C10BC